MTLLKADHSGRIPFPVDLAVHLWNTRRVRASYQLGRRSHRSRRVAALEIQSNHIAPLLLVLNKVARKKCADDYLEWRSLCIAWSLVSLNIHRDILRDTLRLVGLVEIPKNKEMNMGH